MYIRKSNNKSEAKLFGIKVYEEIRELIEVFDHEFKDDEEEQDVLAEKATIKAKILGIPYIKTTCTNDPDNLIPKEERPKLKLKLPLNKVVKVSLITSSILIVLISIFALGIYTANTDWFNNTFYIKSRQMQNLNIKGLRQYDKLLAKADCNVDMSNILGDEMEYYHQYYERVVKRISELPLEEVEMAALNDYIDRYEERKAELEYVMFPHLNDTSAETGYGTYIGVAYPSAMLEFDRQELLTLRMILTNMYDASFVPNVNAIFEE